MGAYISATSAISPQHTFDEENYLKTIESSDKPWLSAIEPDYKNYLDPRATRRMARVIKMSVTAAKICLQRAQTEQPGAVIVGTGFGCLQDTEKFLADIIENKEGLLSPTSFIQSTHNTIAGQIALTLGCLNHNFTFVQREHSFETALEDGMMLLNENNDHILVGGVDEIIKTVYDILTKVNCVNARETQYPTLNIEGRKPSLGEGATFFILSKEQTSTSLAHIDDMKLMYGIDSENIDEIIKDFLSKNSLDLSQVDAVVMGYNGDQNEDVVYHQLEKSLFKGKVIISFKNLCGEYFTASAFGHHLAANVIHKQEIFPETRISGELKKPVEKLLFYNSHKNYHTLTLMSKCPGL